MENALHHSDGDARGRHGVPAGVLQRRALDLDAASRAFGAARSRRALREHDPGLRTAHLLEPRGVRNELQVVRAAEDVGEVLSVAEQASVPFGSFDGVLMTKDFTPLDPKLLEHKFYARGVGPVLALTVAGGSDREELVRFDAAP